jgi:TOMM system kinase/cyclase fusion protein
MEFEEVLEQAIALLQHQGRVSYGALKRRFKLDDAYLEDLKIELIEAQQLAHDENGRILVWSGGPVPTPSPAPATVPQPFQATQQPHTREDQTPPGEPTHITRRVPEAERRQITVMFCDLVDSTALAARLDPEDLREVVRAYQETSAAVIQRFGGYIAQYLGDGLLVYFGYPQAHEDDAQRAVRAGLGLVVAIGELNARLAQHPGIRLAVRIGIHTGLVVVGEMGGGSRQEQLALGETPNVAARIQGLAAPDTVAISPATFRLVRGYFTCQDLGSHTLKGLAAPLQVYRILGASAALSRLEAAEASGFTPLVGRASEVALLRERWVQSQEGRGQVVLLRGEAGIGKSRLVEALRERVRREGATRIAFRCSPYYQNSALYPVIDHLQRFLQWQRDDAPEAKLDTLERVLRTSRLPLEDVVPLFAALLSVPLPERYAPLHLTPQQQRQKTQEALAAWLLEEAERQPILVVWEDLHWADPSTLEWLSLVLDQAPMARMLTLLTCRPEFRPPWGPQAPVTQVILNRLGHAQVETMITHLTGGKALPAEVVQQVVVKTDGIPLFVEELVKMILESGLMREEADRYVLTGPLPPLAIPSTLHDSLMARLDRLSATRDLAQLGAVLGREFSYELLQVVSPLDEATLQQGLAQLVDAELVYQRGLPPHSWYVFKHALIQEAAYQSLLRSTRQRYHQHIAQILEGQFPETVETQPELLAHHYTEAGLSAPAVDYWQRAGRRATEHSANAEAISHLTRGLEVLQTLAETPERLRCALTLQTLLAQVLKDAKGYGHPEVEQAYTRARELCQHIGETPQLFPALLGLSIYYVVRAELQTARELGAQLLSLAQRAEDPVLLVEAYYSLGVTCFWLGEFALAREYLEQGIIHYDPQRHRSHLALFGQDGGAVCLCRVALVLWYLGYLDQALAWSQEARILARELSHPFSLAYVLLWTALLYNHRQEVQETQELADTVTAFSTERGFPYWSTQGMVLQGWALAAQGQEAEGMAQIHQGLVAMRATGTEVLRPYFLGLLANECGKMGQAREGLALLDEALALVHKTGECWPEAELHRLKGELLLALSTDNQAKAEGCLHQAFTVARRQQAKAPELRAATSLSRLWQRQGKRTEAHQLLTEIYGWFTEGFDTADLQDAKALLEELA